MLHPSQTLLLFQHQILLQPHFLNLIQSSQHVEIVMNAASVARAALMGRITGM
jgi:hypothetical protein